MQEAEVRASLEQYLGKETVTPGVDEVSRNDIRRKLEVYCFDCPLHYDDAVAQDHGYKGVIAPAALIPMWSVPPYWIPGESSPWAPGLRERNGTRRVDIRTGFAKGFNAAAEWEAFEPVYPGDHLTSSFKLVKIEPKTTRLGEGVFLTYETRLTKQTGETVIVSHNTQYSYDPTPERVEAARSAATEQADVSDQPQESGPADWSRQLHYEDVNEGEDIPPYYLWLNYQRIVMSVAVDRMWGSIHHNREMAREAGLDDIIFNTRGYEMMFEITLRRWIGLDGRILKLGPFRMVKNSHPGDTLTSHAKVVSKEIRDGKGIVNLEIGIDNPRAQAARGEAVVSVPL